MSRLTEDLLTLARVESGEQRFDIQKVSADELLQDALESFREMARSYEVELLVENSAPGVHVDADREAIHQIFSNLIENALKYAGSGKKSDSGSEGGRRQRGILGAGFRPRHFVGASAPPLRALLPRG